MKQLKRILVACDSLKNIESALQKAAYLEHYTGCEIAVLDVVWDEVEHEALPDHIKSELKEGLLAGERHDLAKAVEGIKNKVASLSHSVVWHKHAQQPILERIKQSDIDLLIVPSNEHGFSDRLLTPLDWKLIREAWCPVLVSRSDGPWNDVQVVLAAVDTGDLDQDELNQEIAETGQFFASLLDAQLHLVSVHPSLDFSFDLKRGPVAFDELRDAMHKAREIGMQELLCGTEGATTHVVEGKASVEIAKLANQLGPTLTLVGTHGRHGIGKWVLGNTSESTMARLEGDLLVVRER